MNNFRPNKPREDVIFMVYGGKQAKSTSWNQSNELKKFKQTHSPQVDSVNDNTGEEEYGYDKAEEIRTKQFNSSKDDYKAIWKTEGLE